MLARHAFSSSPEMENLVLGVGESFAGRTWTHRLDVRGRATALAVHQRHGLSPLAADVLVGRGVGLDEVEAYLSPHLRTMLPEPYSLTGMEAAAERIARAVESGEHVAIFGDYDVDGATSSAVLATLLQHAGTTHTIYIPDRIFEGYGPNAEAIGRLAEAGARLLVTVDCGTTSHAALAEAVALGLDVVVLDHHQTGETLPEVHALVNPQRADDLSGQTHLAAVGVTFLAVVAINRLLRQRGFWTAARPEPDLLCLLDLVGLGTAADVVPLTGVNRAFVGKGLAALAQRRRPGLRALADLAGMRGQPSPYHLGFLLGPRINAGGRIGRADLGARLLVCEDEAEARAIAEELDTLNRERQAIEAAVLAQACEQAEAESGAVTLVSGEGWHPGIVGLVAARLAERCQRPAFAIALDANGRGTGSGRSIPGVDIGSAVRAAVEAGLLLKGGGHAAAAGVTVPPGGIPTFAAFLNEQLAAPTATARSADLLKIDGLVSAAALQPELCTDLAQAGPFGAGNPEPVLALSDLLLLSVDEVGSSGHLRLRLKAADGTQMRAIAFRAKERPLGKGLLSHVGRRVHLAGSAQIDDWGGRNKVDLRVIDAASAGN
ncbi:single-stranded-DNA-specific exonuclease RecJ [Terrihabitans rhizophilus]|uniref:Single-stranded-DNA-specific exonuclease RecJ n=1 Tax=Terrihabitans rhizophilus TaxID=3092662 RepID=A0ABU4RK46_9HYPH|nr:single-stranded-DNA-specific exonuclease RecJ [Terrihabitans sp. PJ23]MDX6805207.1 single-stranded-DNA-specific exonuclease RecJ [Terrihabitans sp. PJ23]